MPLPDLSGFWPFDKKEKETVPVDPAIKEGDILRETYTGEPIGLYTGWGIGDENGAQGNSRKRREQKAAAQEAGVAGERPPPAWETGPRVQGQAAPEPPPAGVPADKKPRLLVIGGTGYVGRMICRYAVQCGYSVVSLSRRGQNPEPSDPDLVQVVWAKGNATSADAVANVAIGADAVVHAAGLLFDGESGLASLNSYLSGSGSASDPASSYDLVIRGAVTNALESLQSLPANRFRKIPFVFISAAEAGWSAEATSIGEQVEGAMPTFITDQIKQYLPDQKGLSEGITELADQLDDMIPAFIKRRLPDPTSWSTSETLQPGRELEKALPTFFQKYLTAKRAVEAELQSAPNTRAVILRPSLVWDWSKLEVLPLIPFFNLGCRLGIPFVDKAITRDDLARAAMVALMDTNVAGIQRFGEIEHLSDRLGKFSDRLECAGAELVDATGGNASAPSGWAGFRRSLAAPARDDVTPSQAVRGGGDPLAATEAITGIRRVLKEAVLDEAAATTAAAYDCPRAVGQEVWFAEWRRRLEGWWLAMPLAQQGMMGNCLGALGLHLGSRFDAAHRAWLSLLGRASIAPSPPPPPLSADCQWLGEGEAFGIPDFPDFPADFDAFEAPVLPIPRLLPEWQFLQSYGGQNRMDTIAAGQSAANAESGSQSVYTPALAPSIQQHQASMEYAPSIAMGASAGAGTALIVLVLAGARRLQRRNGRLAMLTHRVARSAQQRAPVEIESASPDQLASK